MILDQDTLSLKEMVRDFVDHEVIPVAAEYDKTGEFPMAIYDKAIEMGLGCMYMPERFGGPELSKVAFCSLSEELARGDIGVATSLGGSCLASLPVMIAGTEEQQKHWFEVVAEKKFAAFCLTEPGAGSDVSGVRTTAVEDGDDYIINGTKCFITNGGVAGIYAVLAVTDKSKGVKGLSCFIVERDRPGISIGKEEDKMGMRLSNTTEVIFQDVRVPKANLLGKLGEGFKIMMKTLDASRPGVGAIGVGVAQRALEEAIKYSKERVQFGKPICVNQAIQFMLADMEIAVESARQMYLHAAELADAGLPYSMESSIAKTVGGDAAMKCALDALQIHGGYGYMREYPVEKLVRDAKITQIYEGTNQIQRVVISGQLLK